MLFCPDCSNFLLLDRNEEEKYERDEEDDIQYYSCASCPYVFKIETTYSEYIKCESKKVDDVLGGASAWENVDQTDADCEKCDNTRAYFMQIQIRSADEPSTIFYKCTNHKCQNQWREG